MVVGFSSDTTRMIKISTWYLSQYIAPMGHYNKCSQTWTTPGRLQSFVFSLLKWIFHWLSGQLGERCNCARGILLLSAGIAKAFFSTCMSYLCWRTEQYHHFALKHTFNAQHVYTRMHGLTACIPKIIKRFFLQNCRWLCNLVCSWACPHEWQIFTFARFYSTTLAIIFTFRICISCCFVHTFCFCDIGNQVRY